MKPALSSQQEMDAKLKLFEILVRRCAERGETPEGAAAAANEAFAKMFEGDEGSE